MAPRRIFRFHDDTPYIAWENKSCGHSPGGRLDTGGCHRTRVAATATDRVREREDGYQWLHYTILGGGIYGNTCLPARMREYACARSRAPCRVYTRTPRSRTCVCGHIYVCVHRYHRMGPHRTGRAVHRARQVLPPGEALRRA